MLYATPATLACGAGGQLALPHDSPPRPPRRAPRRARSAPAASSRAPRPRRTPRRCGPRRSARSRRRPPRSSPRGEGSSGRPRLAAWPDERRDGDGNQAMLAGQAARRGAARARRRRRREANGATQRRGDGRLDRLAWCLRGRVLYKLEGRSRGRRLDTFHFRKSGAFCCL